jgi:hypothetical protein
VGLRFHFQDFQGNCVQLVSLFQGKIISISDIPSQDSQYFMAMVSLTNHRFKQKFACKTGMKASAEIITEDMRLIERLFYSFKRTIKSR